MMSNAEYLAWRTILPESGKTWVDRVRNEEPSRRVTSSFRSVAGSFPSKKMGRTVQFESGVERAGVHEYEHDKCVLEFWDQPEPIRLEYKHSTGRLLALLHTPDFLVLREKSAH